MSTTPFVRMSTFFLDGFLFAFATFDLDLGSDGFLSACSFFFLAADLET
jgi:hypothetical protein